MTRTTTDQIEERYSKPLATVLTEVFALYPRVTIVAEVLGVSPPTVHNWIHACGLEARGNRLWPVAGACVTRRKTGRSLAEYEPEWRQS